MADENLLNKVHALSDLELAVLLCFQSREHCLVSTPADALDDLIQELQLIATNTFGLSWVVIDCSPSTTLEDFAAALLLPSEQTKPHHHHYQQSSASLTPRHDSYFVSEPTSSSRRRPSASPQVNGSPARIANVVLARNLDRAPQVVQIQALELLRTRRIFTHTSVQTAPPQFVFIPVLEAESGGEARVTPHLNDFLYIAYWHDPEDGFVNLEDEEEGDGDAADNASLSSVVKRSPDEEKAPSASKSALILESEISHLATLSQQVHVDIEVMRYQMNIVSFLRMHRAVTDGMTPAATKHFGQLMRCLGPLHRLDYVTPALVGLAARKVYLHRIQLTSPDKERSMLWGSKVEAVEALIEGIGPEDVIEDVLGMVAAPN